MEKIPNWLRYLLAIPFGIIASVVIYWIVYYTNLFYSHPESMYMKVIDYLYVNCIQIFVFFGCMNYMLPKHQFKFTVTISIIYCALALFGIGLTFSEISYVWSDYLAFALSLGAFIYSCYYTFNEFNVNSNSTININNSIINNEKLYCNECNSEVHSTWTHCNNCGNKLK